MPKHSRLKAMAQFEKPRHNCASIHRTAPYLAPGGQPAPGSRQPVLAPQADRADVHALLVQELQRLHEGVLARYGLRPSELAAWKAAQNVL
jgi:hypothetical protein